MITFVEIQVLKIMSKIHLSFLLCFVCVSCHFKPAGIKAKEVSDEVVLIFQNCPPDISKYRFPSGATVGFAYDIHYTDNTAVSSEIKLRKAPDSDTIIIRTKDDVLEVRHNLGFSESAFYYLFHKGDSVLFTYEENIPFITILNRETSYHADNYPFFIRKEILKNKLPAIAYYNPIWNRLFRIAAPGEFDESKLIDNVVEEWIHEYKIIDSLRNQNLLSGSVSDYRRNILVNQIYSTCYRRGILVNKIYSTCVKDTALLQYPEIKKMLSDTVFFAGNNDSLLSFNFYREYFLQSKIDNYTKNIKNIITSNSNNPDYFARFDTISNLDFLSAKAKRYFLANELKFIFDSGHGDRIKKYCEKYMAITGDSLAVNKLLTDYKMDFDSVDQLLLMDKSNRQTNLQNVLEKNKGKVIYIDFWASWCAPCKRSMPDAKQLREEYKGKDIVFVYLAFNDKEDVWKKDEQKLEVNYLSESYFITNSKTAQIIKDLNVSTIPRYLLYNKKGKLVHRNAPGPGKEIREQLNKLLKE